MNSDIVNLFNILNDIKKQGNILINKGEYNSAINIYEKGMNTIASSDELIKQNKIHKINELELITKCFLSNIALCYYKLNEFEKCIEVDKSILTIDAYYDKSYARLYLCYKSLKLMNIGIEYGNHLLRYFNDSTLKKYDSIINEIKDYNKQISLNKTFKKYEIFIKRIIPLIIGILIGIYVYKIKK